MKKPMTKAKAEAYFRQLADPDIDFFLREESIDGVPVWVVCVAGDDDEEMVRVAVLLNEATEEALAENGVGFDDEEEDVDGEDEGSEGSEGSDGRAGNGRRRAFER